MAHERFCCCCGFIENEPCGYPKGTIRSALAVIVTSIVCLGMMAALIMLLVYQQWAIAVAVAEAMLGVLGTVLGYYFGTRSVSKDNANIIETGLLDNESENIVAHGRIRPNPKIIYDRHGQQTTVQPMTEIRIDRVEHESNGNGNDNFENL